MNKKLIIQKTQAQIKKKFSGEGTGHDWWHIYRVWKLAEKIGRAEKADLFIVALGALLHDIADFKFHGGDDTLGVKEARKWLESLKLDRLVVEKVCHIVNNVSFKGRGVKSKMKLLEGKVVQDADRLEALGAIGIARAFAVGGYMQRPLYQPGIKPAKHKTFLQYKNRSASTINHFYEKVLAVKNLMNTKTGKKMAVRRHQYVEQYLKRFFAEWQGKD